VAHWTAAAPAADQAKLLWVVVRHEIDYQQAAFLGDGIIARTWVGSASRIRFERFTELLRARDAASWRRPAPCGVPSIAGPEAGQRQSGGPGLASPVEA